MEDQTAANPGHDGPSPEPARVDPIAGELATTTFEYEGGGRRVVVYLPPVAPEAVVYAGDGQLISQWGGYLEAADALREAGADLVTPEREGDHGGPFWQAEFPLMVTWAFGR